MPSQCRLKKFRCGAAIVLVVVALGVLMVLSAFSINVAYMQLARTELQAATDAAAKAGAEALAREDSTTAAKQAAVAYAAKNRVGGAPLALSLSDVQVGRSIRALDGSWEFTPNATPYSAVRVTAGKSVNFLMPGIGSQSSFSPSQSSTAAFSENEICLVIDRSHSMCFDESGVDWSYPPSTPTGPADPVIFPPADVGSRWASLELAMDTFLTTAASVNVAQRVALVTWGSEITLDTYEGNLTGRTFPATSLDVALGTSHVNIMNAITDRGNDVMLGGTNLSAGIDLGVSVLTGAGSHDYATKTMIVMTDGKWNEGRNPIQAAQDAKRAGITLHTVTFLSTADQTDMKNVAKATGGEHYHAANSAELVAAFEAMARFLPVVLTE